MRRVFIALFFMLALAVGGAFFVSRGHVLREPPYEKLAEWGAAGDGPGEFRDPTGIAVSHDKVFVADARNARIQIFSLQGEFLDFFPKAGDATMLGRPMNLDIQDDQLFIADYDLDAVLVFTLDGVFQHAFGAAGEAAGALNSPSGVAALPTGGALVVDFYGGRLQAFDETGAFTTAFAGARKFIYPSDIARRRDAGFVLAEGYAHRLHFVTPDGAIERSFGGFVGIRMPGMPFPGWFKTVSSVAIDPGGRIAATDFYNGRVQMFDERGRFLTHFGAPDLQKPFGIAAGPDGKVYVVDNGASRISVWGRPTAAR